MKSHALESHFFGVPHILHIPIGTTRLKRYRNLHKFQENYSQIEFVCSILFGMWHGLFEIWKVQLDICMDWIFLNYFYTFS